MNISRRDFLRLLGVTGAVAGGYSRVWAVPDEWKQKIISGPRIETWKVSTCGQCPAGCGIRVRLIDDIPVRILGNPIAPVNRGFTCPMGEAGLELLYHPDRLTQPLVRTGKKGEASFEPVSWDEAIRQVEQGLTTLRKEKRTDRFGFILGDGNSMLTRFTEEFMTGFGSPHLFPWRPPAVNELGLFQGGGKFPALAFDLDRCDYLLTFGTNLLEETPSPVQFNSIYGKLKEKRPRTGLKMIHLSPRMSHAGINATEWVKILPGSAGVLALGMVYVIMRDKFYDQEFIGKSTVSTQNIKEFQDMVRRNFYPDRVSELTGVPAEKIIQLARGFESARAPLALSGGTADATETALFNQWAVASLNAVSGSFSPPGLWREPAALPWGPVRENAFDPRSRSFTGKDLNPGDHALPASWATQALPELFPKGKAPDLSLLMIAQADPVFQAANREAWEGFLSNIPRVVQFASFIDDTSPFADIVLPLPTYLEQWDLTLPVPNLPFAQVGLMQPVASPVKGPRSLGDVLARLAADQNVKILPGQRVKSYREYLQARMKQIFDSGKGTPYFEEVSLEFLQEIRKRGWQVYSYPAFSDFWRLLSEKGGWWDPDGYPDVTWRGRKKFAFPTLKRLEQLFSERSFQKPSEGGEDTGRDPLARLEERAKETVSNDTFTLVPFTTLMNITGFGASQPLLQELFGLHPRLYWQTWAEINPERAVMLDLKEDDQIRVTTEKGSFTLPVKIVPTVSADILSVPFGQGHKGSGRYGKNIGTNAIAYLDYRVDPLSGRTSWQSTRVRVEKITK